MIFFPESFFAGIVVKIDDFRSKLEFLEFLLRLFLIVLMN